MTAFSNPATGSPDDTARYVRDLLALLGDRDPFAVLAESPQVVHRRVESLGEEALRRPEAPGKWSAAEVVAHLADTEIVYGWRIRTILERETPAIPGYDQDAWARALRYAEMPVHLAVDTYVVLRAWNLATWSRLDAAQLARTGLHSERGPESVGHIIRLVAAHDLVHRRQLDRILGAAA